MSKNSNKKKISPLSIIPVELLCNYLRRKLVSIALSKLPIVKIVEADDHLNQVDGVRVAHIKLIKGNCLLGDDLKGWTTLICWRCIPTGNGSSELRQRVESGVTGSQAGRRQALIKSNSHSIELVSSGKVLSGSHVSSDLSSMAVKFKKLKKLKKS